MDLSDGLLDTIKNVIEDNLYSYAGVSRSASVVIAYLMQEFGKSMFDAMSFVRRKRPIIFPNPGFQKQLLQFEKTIRHS